jgi:uncharacterized alpha-E superfamily protein
VERNVGRVRSELEYFTISEIINNGMHEFLDRLQGQMNIIDSDIFEAFLSRTPVAKKGLSQNQNQNQSQNQSQSA